MTYAGNLKRLTLELGGNDPAIINLVVYSLPAVTTSASSPAAGSFADATI